MEGNIIKKIIKIISIILGSIIGAGFATGQEIYLFFGKYKIYGIVGIIISTAMISFVLYVVLNQMQRNNFKNYAEYMEQIFRNKKFICYLNENIITVFLLLTFYVMELGFASLLFQQYGISKYVGMLIISGLTYIILRGNVQSVVKTNIVLVPILVLAMLYISISGIKNFGIEQINLFSEQNNIFFINAILYSSYNFIMLLPLLTSLNEKSMTKKEIKIIVVTIFFIIVISSVFIVLLLSFFDVSNVEIPIIYIANFISKEVVILGIVLILLAIFTSVVCVGYSFLNNISKTPKKYNRNLFIMCSISFLLVEFSFASTMQVVYTFLGIVGIIQILAIILANFRKN